MVLRVAAPAKLGAALSLEGQAGGVHEDHAEFGEQVAPVEEQHHRGRCADPEAGAVEITARNDHFRAPEIGDDALLGATVLADVLDQVDVGVGANTLVAGEHALSISRFGVGRICIVADRGMISTQTIAALEQRQLEYVLGVRERSSAEVRRTVIDDQGAAGLPIVVFIALPRIAPDSPICRISRAVVQRATAIPSRPSYRQTLRTP